MNPTTAQPLTHDAEIPPPQDRPIEPPSCSLLVDRCSLQPPTDPSTFHSQLSPLSAPPCPSPVPGGPAAATPSCSLLVDRCSLERSAYRPLGAARDLFNSRRQEILLAGPAGTGKTRAALEKLFLCLLKYPAMRGLLVRKTLRQPYPIRARHP